METHRVPVQIRVGTAEFDDATVHFESTRDTVNDAGRRFAEGAGGIGGLLLVRSGKIHRI